MFKIYLTGTFVTEVDNVTKLKLDRILRFLHEKKINVVLALDMYEQKLDIRIFGNNYKLVLVYLTAVYLGA